MKPNLQDLNDAPRDLALEMLAPLVERSPWVASAALDARPFQSDEMVAKALVETILTAGAEQRLALFNAHPELAGSEAMEGSMTAHSTSEQNRLGLVRLSSGDALRLTRMNAEYRARFGHPFIIALHRVPDQEALFATFSRRLAASPLEEHTTTLAEIASVIRSRSRRAFGDVTPSPFTTVNVTQE